MEKTKGEQLQEELMMKMVNGTTRLSDEEIDKAYDYAEGYKKYMDAAKIEMEAVREAIRQLKENGYEEFVPGKKYQPGERFYYNNRGKSLIFGTMGTRPIEKGVKILAAHVDSPRLDLKPSPLFEEAELGYLRPHYYGGIKKYQWPTIPLALHGDVYKKDGSVVTITIGEDENDPIFCVTDLLPHLSSKQRTQTLAEAFKGESMNILIGSRQFKDEKASEKVKLNLMKIFNEKYGITERDFLGAELSVVPALKARDLGLDRSMIGAYGHDDRVCSYTEMTAEIANTNPEWTSVVIFADKEEVGSDGNTGMHSRFLEYFLADLAEPFGVPVRRVLSNSKCLSADVSAAFDPAFADAYENRTLPSSTTVYVLLNTQVQAVRAAPTTATLNSQAKFVQSSTMQTLYGSSVNLVKLTRAAAALLLNTSLSWTLTPSISVFQFCACMLQWKSSPRLTCMKHIVVSMSSLLLRWTNFTKNKNLPVFCRKVFCFDGIVCVLVSAEDLCYNNQKTERILFDAWYFRNVACCVGSVFAHQCGGCIDYDTDWCCLSKKKAGQGAGCHSSCIGDFQKGKADLSP